MFAAGWNMPGYLPDGASEHFDSFADAKEFMLAELHDLEDAHISAGGSSIAFRIADARMELMHTIYEEWSSGPLDGYVYWIMLAE